jgi:hypothetical protein
MECDGHLLRAASGGEINPKEIEKNMIHALTGTCDQCQIDAVLIHDTVQSIHNRRKAHPVGPDFYFSEISIRPYPPMNEIDLSEMSHNELTDLLKDVMLRLRQMDAEEIKKDFVTKSQKLRLEAAEKLLKRSELELTEHSKI